MTHGMDSSNRRIPLATGTASKNAQQTSVLFPRQRRSEMKTAAIIVGLIGAMFVTGTYGIAQSEPANQSLGAAGASPESDKDVDAAGGRHSTHQKLGTRGAAAES